MKRPGDARVKPIITDMTQKHRSLYGHVIRREYSNVAKEMITMKVEGKSPEGRPIWIRLGRGLSNLKEHRIDSKLAQHIEACNGNHNDLPRARVRSAKVIKSITEM